MMMKLSAAFLLGDAAVLCIGLASGAYLQTLAYGDLMLVRLAEKDAAGFNLCGAYDVDHGGEVVGKWSQEPDGHCHMREYVRGRMIEMISSLKTE